MILVSIWLQFILLRLFPSCFIEFLLLRFTWKLSINLYRLLLNSRHTLTYITSKIKLYSFLTIMLFIYVSFYYTSVKHEFSFVWRVFNSNFRTHDFKSIIKSDNCRILAISTFRMKDFQPALITNWAIKSYSCPRIRRLQAMRIQA